MEQSPVVLSLLKSSSSCLNVIDKLRTITNCIGGEVETEPLDLLDWGSDTLSFIKLEPKVHKLVYYERHSFTKLPFITTEKKEVIVVDEGMDAELLSDVLTDRISDGLENMRCHVPAESHVLPQESLASILKGEPLSKLVGEPNMHVGVGEVKFAVKLIT